MTEDPSMDRKADRSNLLASLKSEVVVTEEPEVWNTTMFNIVRDKQPLMKKSPRVQYESIKKPKENYFFTAPVMPHKRSHKNPAFCFCYFILLHHDRYWKMFPSSAMFILLREPWLLLADEDN